MRAISSGHSGPEVREATTIDAETAKLLHERRVLLIEIYVIGLKVRILGAFCLDEYSNELNDARLAAIVGKYQKFVIYISGFSNRRAAESVARAATWGFEKVFYFRDGLDGWKAAGYPVEVP